MAEAIAELSPDEETKVGSVLVKNEDCDVVSVGYNGFIRGADDAKIPKTRPEKYKYVVHSETNLLYNCARHGKNTNNSTLVCTLSPCIDCTRALFQAGIDEVFVKELYRDFSNNLGMLDIDIEVTKMEEFHHLKFKPRKHAD